MISTVTVTAEPTGPPPASRLRIMQIGDDPGTVQAVAEAARELFEVVRAANGLEALERLDRYEPDIIVADAEMPALSGTDTVRAIRKDARYASVPVVLLVPPRDATGPRQTQAAKAADACIEKPAAASAVLRVLQDLVTQRNLRPAPKQYSVEEIRHYYRRFGPVSRAEEGVLLPSLTEQLQAAAAEPRIRILVVDDDRSVVQAARDALDRDYETIGALDPESVPDKLIAYQPDILLIDTAMPRLDGVQIYHLMRVNRRLRGARVVFLVPPEGGTPPPAGCDMLTKPFTVDQLKRKILEVVRRPGFSRARKRVPYAEVRRREGETPDRM